MLVVLFRKEDSRECTYYRGITLINIPDKIYSKVLRKRAWPVVGEVIPIVQEEPCGFREGRSTTDQQFTLHQYLKRHWEYANDAYMCLVDFEKRTTVYSEESCGECCRIMGSRVSNCGPFDLHTAMQKLRLSEHEEFKLFCGTCWTPAGFCRFSFPVARIKGQDL